MRARDKAATIEAALSSIRRQTVPAEIVVVDSGSRDGTLEIARRWADRIVEIPPDSFSYGRALNIGAHAASAPFHVALSAHCVLERSDWIERSLELYRRADVAGTNGRSLVFDGAERRETFFQDVTHARANPYWGFSNHASSWRAAVWEEHPFDEELEYAEDKEWALRVLAAGWVLAFDVALYVDMSHTWRHGYAEYYRRQLYAARALSAFADVPRYGLRELGREWWDGEPDPRPAWRRRLNPLRAAGLVGKYRGHAATRRG